jgi:hypothetical protein
MLSPIASRTVGLALAGALAISVLTTASSAVAADTVTPTTLPPTVEFQKPKSYKLGAHFEADLGLMVVMRQSAGLAGGVVWGPFRAGLSYTTFLSNSAFGGTPEGFSLRVNHIIGINAAYFIGRSTDDGLYLQAMFHIKQQGVTNQATGDHKDLDSLAAGFELGYLWKVYKGLYVAPRIGALYYLEKPQGPDNNPVLIGNRAYDNPRHKNWDTYFIPTLSVGYSW